MTLTKAIEAAREALNKLKTDSKSVCEIDGERDYPWLGMGLFDDMWKAQEALAALSDKPMTEDEIMKIIISQLYGPLRSYEAMCAELFKALKAANVLYVEEK